MKYFYCLNCPRFGQIIRKIMRIVATGCQILGDNVQNSISAGAIWGTYSAPPLVELTVLPLTPGCI